MKVVINTCFGGFSLSPKAVRRLAELNGRPCYFFTSKSPDGKHDFNRNFPTEESEIRGLFWSAYDVPNPDDFLLPLKKRTDHTESNAFHKEHSLTAREIERNDPKLIQVVEELGGCRDGAAGDCAELRIVEIPDGVEWEIGEYDGNETVDEVHRSWR